MPADARIYDIAEADLEDVAGFLARQAAPAPTPAAMLRRLRWLLLDNPARLVDAPLGWCLRAAAAAAAGTVVGAMLCVPYRLGCAGSSFTALMSCKFFVDEPYRGMGLGLFMRYLKLGARLNCPLFCTTANRASGELWERFGGYPIPGTDHEMIQVFNYGPVLEEWARRRWRYTDLARLLGSFARLWDLARDSFRGGMHPTRLFVLYSPEEAEGIPPPTLPEHAPAVVRDPDYLRWRYLQSPDGVEPFRFFAPDGTVHVVVVGHIRRGYRGQVRARTVMDVWPPLTEASAKVLTGELALRQTTRPDLLTLRSQSGEVEQALKSAGFRRHEFPAPLGWCIDRAGVLPTRQWYLMPGEAE